MVGGTEETESAVTGQTVDVARETATNFERWLRQTIETKPYTSALIALLLGWVLGRVHRPL